METFVLTVVRNNILDNCEVFEKQEDALDSARYFCEMANIEVKDYPAFDSKVNGWLVSDSYGYFVTVVKRPARRDTFMISGSYGTFLDTLTGISRRSPAYPHMDALQTKTEWERQSALLQNLANPASISPIQATATQSYSDKFLADRAAIPVAKNALVYLKDTSPPPPPAPLDNPNDPALPGGFNKDHRALTFLQVQADPYSVLDVWSLSEHEKFGLVLARAKKRPGQVNTVGARNYNQAEIIKELTNRSDVGKSILNQELDILQHNYDVCQEDEASSSSDYNDDDESYG